MRCDIPKHIFNLTEGRMHCIDSALRKITFLLFPYTFAYISILMVDINLSFLFQMNLKKTARKMRRRKRKMVKKPKKMRLKNLPRMARVLDHQKKVRINMNLCVKRPLPNPRLQHSTSGAPTHMVTWENVLAMF